MTASVLVSLTWQKNAQQLPNKKTNQIAKVQQVFGYMSVGHPNLGVGEGGVPPSLE